MADYYPLLRKAIDRLDRPGQAARYYVKPGSRPTAANRPAPVRPAATPTAVASAEDLAQPSYILRRQRVFYRTTHPPGTIAVSLNQKFLYLVQPNQVAIRYTIGIGP